MTLPEHLLAALVLLDVDAVDLLFEREVPIGDGSAGPFVAALRAAGLTGRPRSRLRVSTAGASTDRDPSRARTFIDRRDATRLRPQYRGARPGDAVVRDGAFALYGGRPRMREESAHHKLLDLLGDLGPWRALGPLAGHLQVGAPRHVDNPGAIAAAFERGELRVVGCR